MPGPIVPFDYEKRDQPQISWALRRRVWDYAGPYRLKILGLLITIFVITGLSLIHQPELINPRGIGCQGFGFIESNALAANNLDI